MKIRHIFVLCIVLTCIVTATIILYQFIGAHAEVITAMATVVMAISAIITTLVVYQANSVWKLQDRYQKADKLKMAFIAVTRCAHDWRYKVLMEKIEFAKETELEEYRLWIKASMDYFVQWQLSKSIFYTEEDQCILQPGSLSKQLFKLTNFSSEQNIILSERSVQFSSDMENWQRKGLALIETMRRAED